jgi:Tfp pilus assembly protein PilF
MKRISIRGLLVAALVAGTSTGCKSLMPFGGSKTETAPLGASAPMAPASSPTPKLVELPPSDSAKVCLATAELMEKDGKIREAISLYERARQIDPKQRIVCRRLAVLFDRAGDQLQAAKEYDEAIKLFPKDADLWNDIGFFHYNRGRWADAEKSLRQAIALQPKHERAWINLGMTLSQEGKYDEGLAAFMKAVPQGQACCNLAFILTAQGKRDEARKMYQMALSHEPDLEIARTALAKLNKAG